MNLQRMIVADMHKVVPRSCYDYRAEALPVSRQHSPTIPAGMRRVVMGFAGLLIRTGKALKQVVQPKRLTPKSSRYIYSLR